jgi:putative ABC transport system ATP-binding protein
VTDSGLPPVITLDHLTKVFATDEVETHALEDISLEIARGEYVSISGPSGAASRRCCRFSACSTPPARAPIASTGRKSAS